MEKESHFSLTIPSAIPSADGNRASSPKLAHFLSFSAQGIPQKNKKTSNKPEKRILLCKKTLRLFINYLFTIASKSCKMNRKKKDDRCY